MRSKTESGVVGIAGSTFLPVVVDGSSGGYCWAYHSVGAFVLHVPLYNSLTRNAGVCAHDCKFPIPQVAAQENKFPIDVYGVLRPNGGPLRDRNGNPRKYLNATGVYTAQGCIIIR